MLLHVNDVRRNYDTILRSSTKLRSNELNLEAARDEQFLKKKCVVYDTLDNNNRSLLSSGERRPFLIGNTPINQHSTSICFAVGRISARTLELYMSSPVAVVLFSFIQNPFQLYVLNCGLHRRYSNKTASPLSYTSRLSLNVTLPISYI